MAQIPIGTRRYVDRNGVRMAQRWNGRRWKDIPGTGSTSSSSHSTGSGSSTSLAPGNLETQPARRIFVNAPFDYQHNDIIKIINASEERIAFRFKTTFNERLGIVPTNGVLDPKESINIAISIYAFNFEDVNTKDDRIDIDWTKPPEGTAKEFDVQWFKKGEGIVRRKNIFVRYNL